MKKKYVISPHLFMVQSRLYSPTYSGPGKWIIFNSNTRRAFLAVGKDRLPEVIPILKYASKNPIAENDLESLGITSGTNQLALLEMNGLLIQEDQCAPASKQSFVRRYHEANYDYPFQDYMDATWRQKDQSLMTQYKKMWSPPENMTTRQGVSYPLPIVSTDDMSLNGRTSRIGPLTLNDLAVILKFTFAPIGEIPANFGPWLRKTSPSGGARHPTEGCVLLPQGYENIPAGAYVYDIKHHSLVDIADKYPRDFLQSLDKNTIGFLIISHVERPMWRYRDLRSLRPVLLDAGHIIETLSLLLGTCNMATTLLPPILNDTEKFTWLKEPEFALLLAGPQGSLELNHLQQTHFSSLINVLKEPSDKHLTNAGIYITFEDGEILAHVVWPELCQVVLSLDDFLVLTHCLPSQRGDRDTTWAGITTAIEGITLESLQKIYDSNVLLSEEIAQKFYFGINIWVQHDWYLALLALLEVRTATSSEINHLLGEIIKLDTFSENELVPSLLQRRTTRKFSSEPIKKVQLEHLLNEISATHLRSQGMPLQVFLACLFVDGLEPGLYEWNGQSGQLKALEKHVTAEEIRVMTIGQECAGAGALTIWLVRRLNLNWPQQYALDIIELGRVGQRICLSSTREGLGVFLTPAVSDENTYTTLGIDSAARESIIYSFTIGNK